MVASLWSCAPCWWAVRSSGAFTDERERATWDAVMLTPLSTHEIVRGKFWGLNAAWAPYLLAYGVATLPLAACVSLTTVVACFFAIGIMAVYAPWIAAVGLVCSAFVQSSWRSLLATLGICYAYYLFLAPFLIVPSCMVAGLVGAMFAILMLPMGARAPNNRAEDLVLFVMWLVDVSVMLFLNAAILWPVAWAFLSWAHSRIDKAERAKVTRGEGEFMQFMPRLERLAEELEWERE